MKSLKRIMNIFNGVGNNASVTINGQTYTGNHVSIVNGTVIIDGNKQDQVLEGPISVVVNGNVDRVETTSGDVDVTGSTGTVSTMSGSVTCGGNISGDVSTMSGSVRCDGSIGGSVETMSGSIRSR
jgi:hypothetical protein